MYTSRLGQLLDDPIRRFRISLLLLALLILFGTVGYMVIEDLSAVDALYMTIITITTVGFGEIGEPSQASRIFTIVVIVLGVGAGAWAIRNGVEIVLGDTLWHSIRMKKMRTTIEELEGHYIVCGYGRIGRQIVRDMQRRRRPFVIVDTDEERMEDFMMESFLDSDRKPLVVIGDATLDATLQQSGIERAAGLVAALDSDADNVLAVLTARGLNESMQIVARASTPGAVKKLRRAGADRVVSPYAIGGHRLALSLLQPTVHEFFNRVFNVEHPDVDIGEVEVREGMSVVGRSIASIDPRGAWGLSVIAIRRTDGSFSISPDATLPLEVGEYMIVIGDPERIGAFADSLRIG